MVHKSEEIGRSKVIKSSRFLLGRTRLHVFGKLHWACLFSAAFGLVMLSWVGWLVWYDMTSWGKDLASIFFGSRTGEFINLGIGMRLVHYFTISLSLLIFPSAPAVIPKRSENIEDIEENLAQLTNMQAQEDNVEENEAREDTPIELSENEEKGHRECPQHLGYLASRQKNSPIPQECFVCLKILECINNGNPETDVSLLHKLV